MKNYLAGILCLVFLNLNQTDAPDSGSNEAQWAEFVAGVLNVEEEGVEYILPDGRRIDIYDKSNNISYEVDWCQKWEEGIGQSLGYAIATNSDPGLILLFKNGDDEYYNTALGVVNQLRERGFNYKFIVVNVGSGKIWKY
ncbi:MAG: hypothetical protein FI729_03285 [SAR202 cluster bacterium]|nr:hypothetical protein [SAR202 cluster bacterium]|tara:strand:- start:4785 stop:5204 length:420 start_codon:yes stop_codon:yes gene_type:complete